jgi:hypothetical protein
MYQSRHHYEYTLCHKNHVIFHCYRILWVTFTWNKILSDIISISTCQGSFKPALWLWYSILHIPYLGSNITHTFNTGTSCWLVWSEESWGGNTCFLPQSKVNEFVDDVHRGRSGEFLDHFQPETNGIPWPCEQHILRFFNDSPPWLSTDTPDHTNSWELQLTY